MDAPDFIERTTELLGSGTVGESYTPDTRPTVITGDYGIVDNQGVATVIKDCTIVNETTNNYYNPATGQNYPIKDWSYDGFRLPLPALGAGVDLQARLGTGGVGPVALLPIVGAGGLFLPDAVHHWASCWRP